MVDDFKLVPAPTSKYTTRHRTVRLLRTIVGMPISTMFFSTEFATGWLRTQTLLRDLLDEVEHGVKFADDTVLCIDSTMLSITRRNDALLAYLPDYGALAALRLGSSDLEAIVEYNKEQWDSARWDKLNGGYADVYGVDDDDDDDTGSLKSEIAELREQLRYQRLDAVEAQREATRKHEKQLRAWQDKLAKVEAESIRVRARATASYELAIQVIVSHVTWLTKVADLARGNAALQKILSDLQDENLRSRYTIDQLLEINQQEITGNEKHNDSS